MKLWLIVFLQISNFRIASVRGGMCTETSQECFNCKAAADCAPYREIRTAVSKDDCIALLENVGNTMVEYETGPGICKAFNCQHREEAQGFSTVIVSCRTDCPQYIIESRVQQSGSCVVTSRFATSNGRACLQFCLHRDGCMGVTHLVYPNDVNICTFHTCSSSVLETMYNSTFVGINCTTVQDMVASSTYISTPQAELLTTQLQGNHTTVQNPMALTTFAETEKTSTLTQTLSSTVIFSSSEWTPMHESSDLRRLSTTTMYRDTSSNADAVLITTASSWAVSSVVGSAVAVLASNC